VRNAKSFIHQHLAEPMSLEAVASAVNVSPFHFCKLFKRATGLTFTDFVNRARVEKAKRMLMKPAARITEVAYDVGFQSLSHFNRSFRRIADESPTEFRSRMKNGSPALLAAKPPHIKACRHAHRSAMFRRHGPGETNLSALGDPLRGFLCPDGTRMRT
jgi:AraC-like DNA-binding protein